MIYYFCKTKFSNCDQLMNDKKTGYQKRSDILPQICVISTGIYQFDFFLLQELQFLFIEYDICH